MKAYPFQKQEAFLDAHESGFHFNGGVPHRITYDNLKTAVFKILEGHNRQEQEIFKAFRSYYLFDSRYCTPAQGHEKGGVENDVGYAQRNFFSPILRVNSYEELNQLLLECCLNDEIGISAGKKRQLPNCGNWTNFTCCLYPGEIIQLVSTDR